MPAVAAAACPAAIEAASAVPPIKTSRRVVIVALLRVSVGAHVSSNQRQVAAHCGGGYLSWVVTATRCATWLIATATTHHAIAHAVIPLMIRRNTRSWSAS